MKKIIALAAIGLALAGCEDGDYFNSNTVQMKSEHVGRLEAVGFDLSVYEFTPQSAPWMQCVFTAGENKGGLFCFPKKQ